MTDSNAPAMIPHARGYPIKIVRDNTPQIINSSGEPGDLFYAPYDGDVEPWMRKKLGEEVTEFLVDGGLGEPQNILMTIADLAERNGSSLDELVDQVRSDPRGGFSRGIMMYGLHPEFDQPAAD